MEQLKISTIVKAYPNSFVIAQPVKRSSTGGVLLAHVLGAFPTKEETIVQLTLYQMLNVDVFVIPTFDEPDEALQITMSDEEYSAEPLLTPAENAALFRMFYGLS